MSAKDDLIAAKALIADPDKWCKGSWQVEGRYCALGALREVLDVGVNEFWAFEAPLFLDSLVPGGRSVAAFNDNPATTHSDVLALFDRAIEAAQ